MSRGAFHELFARPSYEEALRPVQWRQLARVRLVLALLALAIDAALVIALRDLPQIDADVLDRFAAINVPIIGASAAASFGMLRSASFHRVRLLAAIAGLEAASVIVWVQATGSLTSYFLLAGPLILVFYRLYTSWAVAAAVAGALVVGHVAVIVGEAAGVLDPMPLFRGAADDAYRTAAYQLVAASSVAWIYLLAFVSSNAIVNKLREKDRAIAELQREVDGATMQLRHGRLTGLVVAGEYVLHELLGRGGMGEVYAARRISHGDDVALKILHGHLSAEDDLLERFRREARLAAQVPAAHVARVLEIGADLTRDLHFIAMERLHGEDLSAHLQRHGGRVALAELVPLARRMAAAVDAAHVAGVVHRDLKPHNVFLAREGAGEPRVVLLDFGLSKALAGGDTALTATDALMGTVSYMAPEQAQDLARTSAAADLYSFAAILYRAVTGAPAFEAENLWSAAQRLQHHRALRPTLIDPSLPAALDPVFAVALARDPHARFASAAELVDALEEAAAGCVDAELRRRAEAVQPLAGHEPTLTATRT